MNNKVTNAGVIFTKVRNSKQHTIFNSLLKLAGDDFIEHISKQPSITLFAPTDDACEKFKRKLPTSFRFLTQPENVKVLQQVLLHHFVHFSFSLRDIQYVGRSKNMTEHRKSKNPYIDMITESYDGISTHIFDIKYAPVKNNSNEFIIDGKRILFTMIEPEDDKTLDLGVMYSIDAFLMPQLDTEISTLGKPTFVEVLTADGDFSILLACLNKCGLIKHLLKVSEFTLFAPTDSAFNALHSDILLRPNNATNLRNLRGLLLNHILPLSLTRKQIEDGPNQQNWMTIIDDSIRIDITQDDLKSAKVIEVGGSEVIEFDKRFKNGIIHVVNELIVPDPLKHIFYNVDSD
jgi:uncharacterized surface protein with fasciclin (FAS1) repeats